MSSLEPKEVVLEAWEELVLSCAAESDPRLAITYAWLRDGRPVDLGSDHAHVRLKEANVLWLSARGRHSGHYTCVAATDVDEIRSEMELLVKGPPLATATPRRERDELAGAADVPEAPEVTEVECNERRALIRWKPAKPNGEPVFRYRVEKATAFHPDRWITELEETQMDPHLFEVPLPVPSRLSSGVHFKCGGVPGADLAVPVGELPVPRDSGEFAGGERAGGAGGGPLRHLRQPPLRQPRQRLRRRLRPRQPRHPMDCSGPLACPARERVRGMLDLEAMEKEDWNGEELRYLVRHKLDEPGTEWKEFQVEDPLAEAATIRDQPTFRKYLVQVPFPSPTPSLCSLPTQPPNAYAIQVRAVNVNGPSIATPDTIIGYSGEDGWASFFQSAAFP